MPKRFTPKREIAFSQKPAKPGDRGRVIRLEVGDGQRLVDTPAGYDAAPVGASGTPQPDDGDRDNRLALTLPTPLRPSQRARRRVDVTDVTPDVEEQPAPSASQLAVQTLITSAVSGWLAVIYERALYSLQIAPSGGGVFECEALMSPAGQPGVESDDPADLVYLRVTCGLGAGKLVRTEVQPLGPR